MSEPTDTTAPPPDEPKPGGSASEMPAESAVAETVPQAEAGVETATEPDPEYAPEPAPTAPPELAEPIAAEAGVAQTEESSTHGAEGDELRSEELVPTQEPESEALVPVHDAGEAAGGEEPQTEELPREQAVAELGDEEAPAAKSTKKPRTKKSTTAASPFETGVEPAEPTGTVEGVTAEAPPASNKKWYAIKVQSGREDTIKSAILRKVAIEGLEEYFGRIEIPVEEEVIKKSVRVKDKKTGEYTTQEKKVTRKKKKFQGYLFAELEFNDRILYLFRETSGVGDFLNLRGTPPVPEPMPAHEVEAMLTGVAVRDPLKKGGKVKVKLDFEKGDRVRVREDSFAGQEGEVKAITEPKDPTDTPKITVVLTFWGRPLEVELDYWKVEKV